MPSANQPYPQLAQELPVHQPPLPLTPQMTLRQDRISHLLPIHSFWTAIGGNNYEIMSSRLRNAGTCRYMR